MTKCDGAARTLASLARAPADSAAAIILRHAEREEIPPDDFGNDIPLTRRGRHSAHRLGAGLSHRMAGVVQTSPVLRCTQTADAIIAGAGWATEALPDQLLGNPGPFVTHPNRAGQLFLDIGTAAMVSRQLTEGEPPDGMRATAEGVQLVLGQLTAALAVPGSVSLFVTHDAVLAALVGSLYGLTPQAFRWPDYLDGLVVWPDSGRLRFLWYGLDEGSHPIGG